MASISVADLNSWTDGKKFTITQINTNKLDMLLSTVKANLSAIYDTSSWIYTNIPESIKTLLSMRYVGYEYQSVYSDDNDVNDYGTLLLNEANKLEALLISTPTSFTDMPVLQPSNKDGIRYVTSEPVFRMDQEW